MRRAAVHTKLHLTRYREAELKHGRVAMLAAWGMITQDAWHPLFDGKLSANPLLAIIQVRSQPRSRHKPTVPCVRKYCARKQHARSFLCSHLGHPLLWQTPKLGVIQILIFIAFIEVIGILNTRRADYEPGNFLGSSQWETGETWENYQLKVRPNP